MLIKIKKCEKEVDYIRNKYPWFIGIAKQNDGGMKIIDFSIYDDLEFETYEEFEEFEEYLETLRKEDDL